MAPTGQREQISHIDDLDSVNTGTNVYKREKSVNLSAVNGNRPKCVEHDVPNLPEIANIQQKLYPEKGEDVLDDGKVTFMTIFKVECYFFSPECGLNFGEEESSHVQL